MDTLLPTLLIGEETAQKIGMVYRRPTLLLPAREVNGKTLHERRMSSRRPMGELGAYQFNKETDRQLDSIL
jgi:hypothetical protein